MVVYDYIGDGMLFQKHKYALYVSSGGIYEADSLIGLITEIIKHRFTHFMKDKKWMD